MALSFRAGTNWCHDFPKIARESGFHFNAHRTRVRVDWKRISSVDIDRIVAERDFSSIDDNINNIVDCCPESEYDVKILEPNFVKLFRLAQLAVEYLLYCKQYLDRSVMILKDELRSKLEENVKLKKELDDTTFKENPRKLNDSNGEIHKCPRCPKTFVSALFMNAHVNRRHAHTHSRLNCERSPVHRRYLEEAEKLHNEIKTLKERLNRTERVIRNESEKFADTDSVASEKGSGEGKKCRDKDEEEYDGRYQREIRHFKAMLLSEIRNLKLVDATRGEKEDDYNCENVKELIRRQEKEIERLRDQLQKRLTPDIEGIHAKLENQEDFWQSKIDNLETRHRIDIEKLYSQLKVSHESVNEMRLDYMSKINDLEWRSRSESALIQHRTPRSERSLSPATRDNDDGGGGEGTKVASVSHSDRKESNRLVRENRQGRDGEKINDGSMRKSEDVSVIAENASPKDTIRVQRLSKVTPMPVKTGRRDEWRTRMDVNTKSDTGISLRTSNESDKYRHYRSSIINKSKQDTSSIDSDDHTTGTASDTSITMENVVSGTALRRSMSAEKCNVPSITSGVEGSCTSSPEESPVRSVESRTEDTDESRISVDSKDREFSRNRINEGSDSIEQRLDSKLRDLGMDPEWRAIPNGTFAQIMETIGHERNLRCKKYPKFNEIRHNIIEQIARTLLEKGEKVATFDYSSQRSPLEKLVTNVKSKASKALRILEKNEGFRRGVNSTRTNRAGSIEIKKLGRATPRIYGSRAISRKPNGNDDHSVDSVSDLKHSYESIKDFVKDTNRKLVTSTPQRNDPKLIPDLVSVTNDDANNRDCISSLSGSPKNNGKGVLKSASATNGSRMVVKKKKVLFDLEGGTSPEREEEEYHRPIIDASEIVNIGVTPRSGSIVLKTRQSEKIAQISKRIEKQLSIPREKPVGAVEAMFIDKFSPGSNNEESTANACRPSESTSQLKTKTSTDSANLPQPAPRVSRYRFPDNGDSNLDMDIEELLEIQ